MASGKKKTFARGDAVEVISEPTGIVRSYVAARLWEPAKYVEPITTGRYKGWHWVRSSGLGQLPVPARRIRAPERKLTEDDWRKVFAARCDSKSGRHVTKEQRALVDTAYREDQKRYEAMEPDVFDATVPFGSTARWPR